MGKLEWNRLKGIIVRYRHGRISREMFVLDWRIAGEELGIERRTDHARAVEGPKRTEGEEE